MPITYTIAINANHDSDFTDTGEDITAHVLDLKWKLGFVRPYDSLAEYSTAQITVRNPTGTFSPERTTLDSGTQVRIQSDDGTTTRTQFVGYVSHVTPSEGDWSDKTAVIHLQDSQPWLDDSLVNLPPQIDITADAVIDVLLDQAILRRAVIGGYCIIDVDGYNLIDSVTIFPDENITRSLETGKTQFAYIGDWWQESVPVRQAIRDVVDSERGRFYISRDGQATFLNRHYTLITKTLSATFNNDMHNLDYSYGDERLNRLSIIMTPREIGVNDTILWQLDYPQRFAQETQYTLNLRFIDVQNLPIGMLEFDDLTAVFNTSDDALGQAVTENVSVNIVQTGFTSMQIQVSNQNTSDVYLTSLVIRGKPLYRRDPLEIMVSDGEGMYIYGLKSAVWDLPALSNMEVAQAFAEYEITRRKHPSGTVQTLTAVARDHPTQVLGLTLFDRIRITESQTGQTTQEYFIIAEAHHVSKGGTQHQVTWTLEPADSTRFVIINDSNIDSSAEVIAPY